MGIRGGEATMTELRDALRPALPEDVMTAT
jgi:hypothetical protein